MFYERFMALCKERGKSAAAVVRDMGLNNSAPTTWKRGSIPKGDTLQRLADYFGVSVDYLMGLTKDPGAKTLSLPDSQLSDKIDDADAELVDTVHQICGMDRYKIADDYAMGNIREIWNPAKIHLVREYIQDSQAVLKKMFTAAGYDTGESPPASKDTTAAEPPPESPENGE